MAAIQPDGGGGAEACGQNGHEGIHRDPAPRAPPGYPHIAPSLAGPGAVASRGGQPAVCGAFRPGDILGFAREGGTWFACPGDILGLTWAGDIPAARLARWRPAVRLHRRSARRPASPPAEPVPVSSSCILIAFAVKRLRSNGVHPPATWI